MATIVGTRGSTPREFGARMMVAADGTISGTIGGGCGEHEVFLAALDVILTGLPRRVLTDLISGGDEGAVCGGIMDVFIEPVSPGAE